MKFLFILVLFAVLCYAESASLTKRQVQEFNAEEFKAGLLKHAEDLISRADKDVAAAGESMKEFATGVEQVVAHIKELVEKVNAATDQMALGMLEWELMQAEGMLDWELAMLEQMESGGGVPGIPQNPFNMSGNASQIPGNPVKRQVQEFNAEEFKAGLLKHAEDLISRADKDVAAADETLKDFSAGVQQVVAHIKELVEKINAATDQMQLGMLEWDLMQAEGMLDWELAMMEQMESGGGIPGFPQNPFNMSGNASEVQIPGNPVKRQVQEFNAEEFKAGLLKHAEELLSRAEKDMAAVGETVKEFATGVEQVVAHIKELVEKVNAATDQMALGMLEWELMQAEGMLDWELSLLEQMESGGGVPQTPLNPGNHSQIPA